MKNVTIAMIIGLISFATYAQDNKKNTYIMKGDLIEATLYFDNGDVSQTGFYTKEGKLTGTWTSFDRAGNKTAVAQYSNGKKTGKWFFWGKDTLREVDYKNEKIVEVNTWVNNGTRVVTNN